MLEKLHNYELEEYIIRVIRWRKHIPLSGENGEMHTWLIRYLEERDYLQDLVINGRISKWTVKEIAYCVDLVNVAEDWYLWWAVVNGLMNLQVPKKVSNPLSSCADISFWKRTSLCGVSKWRWWHKWLQSFNFSWQWNCKILAGHILKMGIHVYTITKKLLFTMQTIYYSAVCRLVVKFIHKM